MHSTIILNARGIKYEVILDKFSKFPTTRLGKLRDHLLDQNIEEISNLCDRFDIDLKEFYFDCDPYVLNKILSLYHNETLHLSTLIECAVLIKSELEYWMIESSHIGNCCRFMLSEKLDETKEIEESYLKINEKLNHKNDFGKGPVAVLKEKLWCMLNKPKSSKCAKAIFIFSIFSVIVSVTDLVIQTEPALKPYLIDHFSLDVNKPINFVLDFTQLLCIICSIIEFSLRVFSCPNKKAFLKSPLNIIDFLSIIPYFLWMIFPRVQQLSVIRVLTLFKVSRYCSGLKLFGETIYRSLKELAILILLFVIAIILFSSIVFYCENEANDRFVSIPNTFWWAIVTLTTLGYGDVYPITSLGRIFGGMCAFSGLIIIALPISIIASNFSKITDNQKKEKRFIELQRELFSKKVPRS